MHMYIHINTTPRQCIIIPPLLLVKKVWNWSFSFEISLLTIFRVRTYLITASVWDLNILFGSLGPRGAKPNPKTNSHFFFSLMFSCQTCRTWMYECTNGSEWVQCWQSFSVEASLTTKLTRLVAFPLVYFNFEILYRMLYEGTISCSEFLPGGSYPM